LSTGTKCGTQSKLAFALDDPGEKQASEVGRSDQERASGGTHNDEKLRP
jgi:hypothetical protein